MAKVSGLGSRLYVAGYDLSGDIGAVETIKGGPKLLEVTGIDKSAVERIGGQFSAEIGFNAWWNAAAGQAHPVLSALPTTDRIVTYLQGSAAGNPAAWLVAKQITYDPKRAADGSLMATIQALSSGYHLYWGEQGTAGKQTFAGAGSGAGVDGGAASAFGATVVLHVFSLGSGTVTVKWQDSADASAWSDIAGLTHTAVSVAPAAEQLQTGSTATIRRYVAPVLTGTFTNAVVFCALMRHQTATI